MTVSRIEVDESLKAAYRATFREYLKQLDTLQNLLQGNPTSERLESARLLVEKARIAHNAARDRLARELVRPPLPADAKNVDEGQIRQTAQLLWEVAGRPEGSAERDWQRAEQLMRTAGASGI